MNQESLIYIAVGGVVIVMAIIYILIVKKKPQKRDEDSLRQKDNTKLSVHKEPISEIKGINLDSFKEFAGSSILAVDDNPINLKLIVRMMEGSGIKIDTAVDGSDALGKLRGDKYDLVLMDINMPVMNGLECTNIIRQDSQLLETPILALTAATNDEMIDQILDCGMNGYLEKPLVLGKLFNAFKLFIDKK